MTVKKVQFESMDEVNRFLDVTEHFPFAVDLKRGSRTVNGGHHRRAAHDILQGVGQPYSHRPKIGRAHV